MRTDAKRRDVMRNSVKRKDAKRRDVKRKGVMRNNVVPSSVKGNTENRTDVSKGTVTLNGAIQYEEMNNSFGPNMDTLSIRLLHDMRHEHHAINADHSLPTRNI